MTSYNQKKEGRGERHNLQNKCGIDQEILNTNNSWVRGQTSFTNNSKEETAVCVWEHSYCRHGFHLTLTASAFEKNV